MIPVEIVVTFVIAYLVFRGIFAHVKLGEATAKIATLEAENVELRETVLRLNATEPLRGPGRTAGNASTRKA